MFKRDFFAIQVYNKRIMFCLMGSLGDSDHYRSTSVVYQSSATPLFMK